MSAARNVDRARGAARARDVAQCLGLTTPLLAAIETLAYMRGALVFDRPIDGSLARLVRASGHAYIIVSTRLSPAPRRFAIAHELGHHELHDALTAIDLCTSEDLRARNTSPEGEANGFAVELLMPREMLARRCDVRTPSLDHAQQIADEFQVSLVAASLRFVELTPEACAVVMCKAGRVDWAVPGADFRGVPRRHAPVSRESLAFELFAGRSLQETPEEVPTEAWLDGRFRGELIEHTTEISSGRTLTLLWQRPDEEEDDEQ